MSAHIVPSEKRAKKPASMTSIVNTMIAASVIMMIVFTMIIIELNCDKNEELQ